MAPEIEAELQSLWLGAMQTELGVLKSNCQLLELRCGLLEKKAAADADLIEALRQRCLAAEQANRELRLAIQPDSPIRKRQARGAHPA